MQGGILLSGNYLEFGLMQASLNLSRICAKEATHVNSPGSKLAFIQHAIGFLNIAYQLKPSLNRSFAARRINK